MWQDKTATHKYHLQTLSYNYDNSGVYIATASSWCGFVCGYISMIKREPLIGMIWNLLILGSEGSSFWTPFISVEQMQLQSSNFVHKCNTGGYCLWIKKICPNAASVTEHNSLRKKITFHLNNALSDENMKWYFHDIRRRGVAAPQSALFL